MTVATCAPSSGASSSSTVVTAQVNAPSLSPEIKWSDFLIEDVFLPQNDQGDVCTQSSMGVSSSQVRYTFLTRSPAWKAKTDIESEQLMVESGVANQNDLVDEWTYGALDGEHGPYECVLNTVEACAISVWPDVNVHFSFIYCVESLVVEHKYLEWESCFSKTGLDSHAVLDCYESGYGKKIFKDDLVFRERKNSLTDFFRMFA
ncbi:hypothetical protein COCNU_04G013470 [Cocos nucifera]|uniref:Uncharacterized protein n=1 Tax=Cocos nucifera TaxID=13894 RepID=A0A8K0I702_COCNU|nr:hypothetical protein COCNU_04G013470 [Cocos nucifera]